MLVTVSDIEAYLGRPLTTDESNRINALLSAVTSYIESYTGTYFEETSFVKILRAQRNEIDILDRPVLAVTDVKPIGPKGTPGASLTDWSFDGIYTLRLCAYGYVVNAPEWWSESWNHTYQVSYSAGYTTVPEDVKAVACNAVIAALSGAGLTPSGVSALTVGDVSYRFGNSSMGQISSSISDADRDILNKYRVKGGTIYYRR